MSLAQGGLLGAEGNANDVPVGLHNNRGFLLTIRGYRAHHEHLPDDTIPFGELVSRWVPAPATSSGAACVAGAPSVKRRRSSSAYHGHPVLVLFRRLRQGFPNCGEPGTYDIWVDDVQFTTDDSGLQTRTGFPLTSASAWAAASVPRAERVCQVPGAS